MRTIRRAPSGPLTRRTVVVYGTGPLGLMTALTLARNGAEVTLASDRPIEEGVGFSNAAGLFEPVASDDTRQANWLQQGLRFARWASSDLEWGAEPRRVLYVTDREELVRQGWMTRLEGYAIASEPTLPAGRRHGAWFNTFIMQPDIAINAIQRELRQLGIRHHGGEHVASVEQAAARAKLEGADFYVLALGLGLASLPDIGRVMGANVRLMAGLGLTIRIPRDAVPVDHVIMDADDFGYLIPQRTMVIGGGTNVAMDHDDPMVTGEQPLTADPALRDQWLGEVREKIGRLWPEAASVAGECRVGARPLGPAGRVLTHHTDDFGIEGAIIGGAGGSGWTFSVGIAHDTTELVAGRIGNGAPVSPLVPAAEDRDELKHEAA